MRPSTEESINYSQQFDPARMAKVIRRLETSRQLTREFVSQASGVKNLLELVFDRVLKALEAEAGSLWIVEPRSKLNICHIAEGPVKDRVIGLRLNPCEGIVGAVIASQKSETILDCSNDERFAGNVDQKTGFVTRSMICVPLAIDGKPYGAIQIVNKKTTDNSQFDQDDCQLVEDLAISAALSVKNAQLLEMQSKIKEMNTLMSISNEVVSTLDLDQVLHFIVNKTNELVAMKNGAIALWDDAKQQLNLTVLSEGRKVDLNEPEQQQLLNLMDQVRIADRASYIADFRQYKQSLKNTTNNNWLSYLENQQLWSLWATPLKDDEGTLGVLWFDSEESGFAGSGKADMLQILASQATVALRNASLFKSIPFGAALSHAKQKSKLMLFSQKRKWSIGLVSVLMIICLLHFLPVFRWVTGQAIVEARLGQGVFLHVAGMIDTVLIEEGDRVSLGQPIARLDSRSIELNLKKAESQLAILERQIVEARAKNNAATMSKAAIERDAVRAAVNKARNDLENIVIRAPSSGLVLTGKPQELKGRFYSLGDELIRIVNPDKMLMLVHIPETDLLDVKIGHQVKAVMRAKPGEYFTGTVRHIGRSYDIPTSVLDSAKNMEMEESLTGFIAEVEITHSPFSLRPGMTGQALVYTPETSIVQRFWRRIKNFFTFTMGF